jgi:hypothetical protein
MVVGLGAVAAFTLFSILACASGTNRISVSGSNQPEENWGITNFPDPSAFTTEIVNLPNPFISWHGNGVC